MAKPKAGYLSARKIITIARIAQAELIYHARAKSQKTPLIDIARRESKEDESEDRTWIKRVLLIFTDQFKSVTSVKSALY